MSDPIATLRTQLQRLLALHNNGALDRAEYDAARLPLERKVLDHVMGLAPVPVMVPVHVRVPVPVPQSPVLASTPTPTPEPVLAPALAPALAPPPLAPEAASPPTDVSAISAAPAAAPAPAAEPAIEPPPALDTGTALPTPPTPSSAARTQPSPRLVGLLAAGVLGLAVLGYGRTGSPGAPSTGGAGAAAQANANVDTDAAPGLNEQQFEAAVEKLAARLKEQPDNGEGWAMLARSYARLGRPEQALPAFQKAVALQGNDASLLADYADVLALQNKRSLEGEPSVLLARALKIDAKNPKALALAGTAAFERKDFKTAVRLWEQLAQLLPPESGFGPQLQASIDQAREGAGLPKGPRLQALAAAAESGASGVAAVSSATVQGQVRLSDAVAKLAAPDDTVFIFARAASGPRMPLAILRFQVKDLPLSFKLDDSTAMAPTLRLSLHPQVVVSARISKSGQAVPTPGDLVGQTAPVANTAQGLQIEINEVLKN